MAGGLSVRRGCGLVTVSLFPVALFAVVVDVASDNKQNSINGVDTPVVFIHVPGALSKGLTRYFEYNWKERCSQLPLSTAINDEAILASAAALATRNSCSWAHMKMGGGSSRAKLHNLSACHGIRPRYLSGHLDFGTCKYLELGCEYVTVLQDPITRMMAHYVALRTYHPKFLIKACENVAGYCRNFEAFVDAVHSGDVWFYGVKNLQTLLLSGNEFIHTRHYECVTGNDPASSNSSISRRLLNKAEVYEVGRRSYDEGLVNRAKYNLATHVKVFGFSDNLKSFQDLMADRYLYRWENAEFLP